MELKDALAVMAPYAERKLEWEATDFTEDNCPLEPDQWEEAAAAILNAAMYGALIPAPQMPEDVADRHSDTRRNVIINRTSTDLENIVNGHDPDIHHLGNRVWDRLDKMAVEIEQHALEAQSAENADLRAKLAEVTAERDNLSDKLALEKALTDGAHRRARRAEQARDEGFAQGIEAAAKEAERVIARFVYFDPTARERDAAFPKAIRALTPPVDVRETPIRCHQDSLTTADEQQAPEMRPETNLEWIARDMREGRFPEQSERQMVPVDAPQADLETCSNCEGTGISGHPDSGNTCANCNGSGGVAPQADPVREAAKVSEIKTLIEDLLDAQQDINLAANTHMDQSLCDASALIDKVESVLRRALAGEQP